MRLFTVNERAHEYILKLDIVKLSVFASLLTYLVFVCFLVERSCVQPLTRGKHLTRIAY